MLSVALGVMFEVVTVTLLAKLADVLKADANWVAKSVAKALRVVLFRLVREPMVDVEPTRTENLLLESLMSVKVLYMLKLLRLRRRYCPASHTRPA